MQHDCKGIANCAISCINGPDPVTYSLLGKREFTSEPHRWFHYVIQKEVEVGTLLYNTLTNELLLTPLRGFERDLPEIDKTEWCKTLARKAFLVPYGFDDYAFAKRIKRMRQLVYRAEARNVQTAPISRYWILTSTNCNARCFYCHEHGIPKMHMSLQTADDVVRYIEKNSQKEPVQLMWYGGEPLINMEAIDRITTRLVDNGYMFLSRMISNGYLLDDVVIRKAVELWHLDEIQITLDGLENTYNSVKNYIYDFEGSPFFRVLQNIESLLSAGVRVRVRVNIDHYNINEMPKLVELLIARYRPYAGFSIYTAPLLENCLGTTNKRSGLQRKAIYQAHHILCAILDSACMLDRTELPRVMRSETRCIAVSGARVIFPDGQLAFCHDYAEGILNGNIYGQEPSVEARMEFTKCLSDMDACRTCVRYPQCVRLEKCFNNQCNEELIDDWIWMTQNEMQWAYEASLEAL